MTKTNRVLSAHEILVVPCPTCGADTNTPCKLISGLRRTQVHRERQWAASDKRLCDEVEKNTLIFETLRTPKGKADSYLTTILPV
jgi:hypothetical protein